MKASMHLWIAAVTMALMLSVADTLEAKTKTAPEMRYEVLDKCQGEFFFKELTPEELRTRVNAHSVWLKVYAKKINTKEARTDFRKANLCGAYLFHADLSGVILGTLGTLIHTVHCA